MISIGFYYLYGQERFLYRLISSNYSENFVLKGGLLFYGVHHLQARPTKDIDFSIYNLNSDIDNINIVISNIIKQKSNDGLVFDPSSLSIVEINEDDEYHGLRIRVMTSLENAIINIQLDMGFGDIIFPKPVKLNYPSLLEDETFEINVYSWESAIAEKFEAMVRLSDLNSRMKDFYDISFIIQNYDFDGRHLKEAIKRTIKHRSTNLENDTHLFSSEFRDSHEKQIQWQAFLTRNRIDTYNEFSQVVDNLMIFFKPVVLMILADDTFDKIWKKNSQKWINK